MNKAKRIKAPKTPNNSNLYELIKVTESYLDDNVTFKCLGYSLIRLLFINQVY